MNVYFDNNVLHEIVDANIDPVSALSGSEFQIAVTPDLATEYRQAIDNFKVSDAEREVCRRLLGACREIGVFGFAEAGGGYSGFDHGMFATEQMSATIASTPIKERPGKDIPKHRTDAFLAALSEGAMIVTNDTGSHYKRAKAAGQHIYSWDEISDIEKQPSDFARRLGALLFQRS